MKKAKDDKNVKAVVFLLDEVDLGLSQVEEIAGKRCARSRNRARSPGPRRFGLDDAGAGAAARRRISVTPTAIILIPGYNSEAPYLRPPVGQDWCNARLSHLRRVQEARWKCSWLGPQRRGGPHEKLAVGQSL